VIVQNYKVKRAFYEEQIESLTRFVDLENADPKLTGGKGYIDGWNFNREQQDENKAAENKK